MVLQVRWNSANLVELLLVAHMLVRKTILSYAWRISPDISEIFGNQFLTGSVE